MVKLPMFMGALAYSKKTGSGKTEQRDAKGRPRCLGYLIHCVVAMVTMSADWCRNRLWSVPARERVNVARITMKRKEVSVERTTKEEERKLLQLPQLQLEFNDNETNASTELTGMKQLRHHRFWGSGIRNAERGSSREPPFCGLTRLANWVGPLGRLPMVRANWHGGVGTCLA